MTISTFANTVRSGKGLLKEYREVKRAEAEWRNSQTPPERRRANRSK